MWSNSRVLGLLFNPCPPYLPAHPLPPPPCISLTPLSRCLLQPEANLIPNSTRVDSFIVVNRETNSCDLVLKTNNDAVIRQVP